MKCSSRMRRETLFARVDTEASGELARGHVNIAGPRTSHRSSSGLSTHYFAQRAVIVLGYEVFATACSYFVDLPLPKKLPVTFIFSYIFPYLVSVTLTLRKKFTLHFTPFYSFLLLPIKLKRINVCTTNITKFRKMSCKERTIFKGVVTKRRKNCVYITIVRDISFAFRY